MGVILDSSVLVAAERQGKNARQTLTALAGFVGNESIGISVITVMELAHGAARANTAQRKVQRDAFVQELLLALPVYPVTLAVAVRAGQIDGENQARGLHIPLPDLLIGVTALELGYSVATINFRHFREIIDLAVVRITG